MARATANPWLHRFAVLTALATLALVCVGGLVTSHGAGMAVPDWPTTFGYNPFFFPISQWVGGVFYEHTHRLVASMVGLLTVVLAVWLWLQEPRAGLRWWGIGAVGLVIFQGVLGGLRVTAMKDELGIFHAALAQLFFVLVSAIALVTAQGWLNFASRGLRVPHLRRLRWVILATTSVILLQLIIAATMRHQHAGLAIPDFPAAYGKVWPDTSGKAITRYNQLRNEVNAVNPITAFQVWLQMVHRFVAVLILGGVSLSAWMTGRSLGRRSGLTKLALAWLGLVLAQVILGAATIWTNKSADIATGHVAVGAVSLVAGALLVLLMNQVAEDSSMPAASRVTTVAAQTACGNHLKQLA